MSYRLKCHYVAPLVEPRSAPYSSIPYSVIGLALRRQGQAFRIIKVLGSHYFSKC
jgi:hypothetical protein